MYRSKMGRRFVRFWKRCNLWSITLEGTLTWWSSDDIHVRERKLDYEWRMPKWIWRPYCLVRRRHEQYYSECVWCGKAMQYPPRSKN